MSGAELTRTALREFPLPEQSDGGKDEHGRLLIVAGSRQVPGSALLAAMSAFRSGAGKVRIATAASIAPSMALHMVEAFVLPLGEADDGSCGNDAIHEISKEGAKTDAVIAGPGMMESPVNAAIAKALIGSGAPVAFDAAMLHALSDAAADCRNARTPPVLLPHVGEMEALIGRTEEAIERDPVGAATRAAEQYGAVVLAKGAVSHIASPDGRTWTYRGGARGLGVAGSGDVLAGIVGGLLARGADPITALLWSVLLHGEAGEALSSKVGPVGFLAREIPDEIPALLDR